tara:strand:- start:984 stop:2201 length:1218 start_codon:yes stop_codon:yes gene_type:complete
MGTKRYIDKTVLEAAQERMSYIFELYEHVSVQFSGGKDSTCVLLLALAEARKRNRLPLTVRFHDEEALHPPTIDYMRRVEASPEVAMEWYCLPFEHRNACSMQEPYWWCWDPDKKDLWCADPPKNGIFEHPEFVKGMAIFEFSDAIQAYDRKQLGKSTVDLLGIRTEESLRRFQIMTSKAHDNWITTDIQTKSEASGKSYRVTKAYPIYDWSSLDVWKLVSEWDADYNRSYDLMNRTRMYNRHLAQRVCQPFGEEPLRGLWMFAECWPDLWEKMQHRVAGVNAAMRYSNAKMWNGQEKPEDIDWREFLKRSLTWLIPKEQAASRKVAKDLVNRHFAKTDEPIPEEDGHIISGISWKFIAMICIRGDKKGRKRTAATSKAIATLAKTDMTLEEAKAKHGKKKKNTA